ncbi:LRR receptor serine/threonine-protein kinase [Salix suchowensis]|nr:LRR receptor serine/threonine-protein kinase [Salix suchowensis]
MNSGMLWIFLLLVIGHSFAFTLHGGNETDKLSLLAFRAQITDDPFGALNSWNESFHFCEWSGVACGRRHQRVVELDLHSYKLVGGLSPSIGNLSFLRLLNLENNSLSSSIPGELGRLFRLQMLRLGNNSFSGEIPANISSCANLIALRLEGNNLTGKLPEQLESLSKLKVLNFKRNNLVGEIPASFGNLSSILDLHSYKLVGGLSPTIGNLSFLRLLNLENNSLSSSIPGELGHLFRLQMLRLGNNSFSGEIPANISSYANLIALRLEGNNLTGKLPEQLESLSKLKVLIFIRNNLVGEIPASFGNLSSIVDIRGEENHLKGVIPHSIGRLKRLEIFSFGVNNLSGTIPPSIFNLSTLTGFAVPVNQLHGTLPPDTNRFSGLIPVTISNASNLSNVQLSYNFFTGKIPSLGSLPNLRLLLIGHNDLGSGQDDDLSFLYPLENNTVLEIFEVADNHLGGAFPEILGNFSKNLRFMEFGRIQIRGTIPDGVGNLVSLAALGLESNQLGGMIPSSIGKFQNLGYLNLYDNKISGSIPSSVGNMTSLIEAYLDLNNLHGSIPSNLGNCRNLLALGLSNNNLSGSIPKELLNIPSGILAFILSENHLTGSLPLEVGNLVHLGVLDVSKNRLSGEIPHSLGSCASLELVSLKGNLFKGSIPESLSSLRALAVLDLSHKNLSGKIPKLLGDLKLLESLDLSFNDLEGQVAVQGAFGNASVISMAGNKKLCGGIPQLNLSRCTTNESAKLKSSTKILIVTMSGGLLVVILVASSVLFYCFRKTKDNQGSIAYQDLLLATNGFSSASLIGVGSFGSVYRGILPPDGMAVVVKVLNLLRKGAPRSFMAECAALVNIRHRNLVRVVTSCSSIDFQGNDFKAIVYELMVNGSLEEWLHPVHHPNNAQEMRCLNLIQKLNISIDVANALNYLHQHCETPIVHCDLKPSNVLLNAEMTACVGDFGLPRLRPEVSHRLSSGQTSSVGLKGTIGYAAPEYGVGSDVSTYGDVYSFGILLLEMFTGKRPTDDMFKDGLNLHNYAEMALPGRVSEVVESTLFREDVESSIHSSHMMNHTETGKTLECLVSIIKIGVACSVELPRERMDIGSAVAELHRVRDILSGTRIRGQHGYIGTWSRGALIYLFLPKKEIDLTTLFETKGKRCRIIDPIKSDILHSQNFKFVFKKLLPGIAALHNYIVILPLHFPSFKFVSVMCASCFLFRKFIILPLEPKKLTQNQGHCRYLQGTSENLHKFIILPKFIL